MDAEMMNPFHEPTLSQRLDAYDKRNKKKVSSPRFTEGEREAMTYAMDCMAEEESRNMSELVVAKSPLLKNCIMEENDNIKIRIDIIRKMLSESPKAHTVDCSKAEKQGGKCTGYGYSYGLEEGCEPIEECRNCPQNSLYGEDD